MMTSILQFEYRIILLFFLVCSVLAKNNVCKNWSDYWFGDKDRNKNCMFNPDMQLDVPDLLVKYYGEYDVHEIPTEDGYFVTTFRIPRKNSRGSLLLIHPAITDSITWFNYGKESVAYHFWNYGYEIWMPNRRGTAHSKRHVNLTVNDLAFWDFGFHETALYDMRATLRYIYEVNNSTRPAVITHSMSCAEMLVYTSLFPEEAQKLAEIFILIAPTTTFKYSSFKYASGVGTILKIYSQVMKAGSFAPSDGLIAKMTKLICTRIPGPCNWILSAIIYGFSKIGEDPLLMPPLFSAGTQALSIKSILHYTQLFASGKFNMYDYGGQNLQIYGSPEPPEYPISRILAPIYLVHSVHDKLSSIKDTDIFYEKLPERAKIYGRLRVNGMNHVDGFVGLYRNDIIYNKVLLLLNKIFPEYWSVFLADDKGTFY